MSGFASRITHGTLNGALQVEGGNNPVRINGIVVANLDATDTFEVTFSDQDSTNILSVVVTAGTSQEVQTSFIAGNGIQADTLGATDGPTCKVTFFHQQLGT